MIIFIVVTEGNLMWFHGKLFVDQTSRPRQAFHALNYIGTGMNTVLIDQNRHGQDSHWQTDIIISFEVSLKVIYQRVLRL